LVRMESCLSYQCTGDVSDYSPHLSPPAASPFWWLECPRRPVHQQTTNRFFKKKSESSMKFSNP
jgi:hypothetical protein